MPRGSAATSSRCRPTRASSSSRWASPTSTRSTGCRRPSPSSRSRARATRARASAPSPRSTTTCACCGRASATSHCYRCGKPIAVADHPADGRPGPGAARGHALLGAGAGRPRPEGRLRRPSWRGCARTATCAPTSTASWPSWPSRPSWTQNKRHTIEVFIDRLVQKDGIRQRLTDSIELAAKLADGLVKISPLEGDDLLFSEKFACPTCGTTYPEITPRLFSFNNPAGRLPGLRRHRGQDVLRPRSDRRRRRAVAARGRHRAVGAAQRQLLPADAGGGGRRTSRST